MVARNIYSVISKFDSLSVDVNSYQLSVIFQIKRMNSQRVKRYTICKYYNNHWEQSCNEICIYKIVSENDFRNQPKTKYNERNKEVCHQQYQSITKIYLKNSKLLFQD